MSDGSTVLRGNIGGECTMALTDEAIEKIKAMILGDELRHGDRLPKESELAEHLGLSRNSPRREGRALALSQVVDVRQGHGNYAAGLEPGVVLGAVGVVLDVHRDD